MDQSACLTPLPEYTSYTGDLPSDFPAAAPALGDTKKSRVMSYVAEQREAQGAAARGPKAQNSAATLRKEPPPYLSRTAPGLQSAGGTTPSSTPPLSRSAASPGLRPLILPTHVARRSAESTSPTHSSPQQKEQALRPLLLPQDLEERSQYEVSARVVFRAERDSDASVSSSEASDPSSSGTVTPGKIESILVLLDGSGAVRPSQSKAMVSAIPRSPLGDIHGSIASLASTYGTTPSCSSAFFSVRSHGSLRLTTNDSCHTDWEGEIISEYCH
ncbi:hypothetical protein PsYK624_016430 [Phanerochaete sordida]|uniref:Uncharacterized protein n=1 Tax=Phanerochaete sordida TaxID=48140 RepID=A0A9P3G0P3_9APHY|nr:hypothetical protein PsYK624_016430 [Phanerochaete sordida]